MKLPSYPKVYAVGHAAIPDLFDGPVIVEEKVEKEAEKLFTEFHETPSVLRPNLDGRKAEALLSRIIFQHHGILVGRFEQV